MEQYIAGKEGFDTALNPTQTILFLLQAAHQQEMPGAAPVLAQAHPPPFVLIRILWALLSTKPPCACSGSSTS